MGTVVRIAGPIDVAPEMGPDSEHCTAWSQDSFHANQPGRPVSFVLGLSRRVAGELGRSLKAPAETRSRPAGRGRCPQVPLAPLALRGAFLACLSLTEGRIVSKKGQDD